MVYNRVENLKCKVWKQVKREKDGKEHIAMKCSTTGRKKEDGTYAKGLPVTVGVTEDTNWLPADYTNLTVLVSGELIVDGSVFVKASNLSEFVWQKEQQKKTDEKQKETPVEDKGGTEWETIPEGFELPF